MMNHAGGFFLVECLLLVSPLLAENVKVKEVTGGDVCVLSDGRVFHYQGIEAADPKLALGKNGLLANQRLVGEKEIRLELQTQSEKHNLLSGFFYIGKVQINEELVRQGYAYVLRPDSSPYQSNLLKAETEARKGGRGLWAKFAASEIVIVNVHPQGSGKDVHGLNDEFILIENRGRLPINLANWKVSDEAHHLHTFLAKELRSKEKIMVHTGSGTDRNNDLHWNSNQAIWNNDHDTVFLFDSEGYLRAWHPY